LDPGEDLAKRLLNIIKLFLEGIVYITSASLRSRGDGRATSVTRDLRFFGSLVYKLSLSLVLLNILILGRVFFIGSCGSVSMHGSERVDQGSEMRIASFRDASVAAH
jgi:hypothetical protein